MAKIVILGAGISGHTAARHLHQLLGQNHEIVVVSPLPLWNWIPSNIWVGVGKKSKNEVTFDLKHLYQRVNITFKQAKATSIHPEGNATHSRPFVTIEHTDCEKADTVEYDYLINATGPKLNFAATPGLGPDNGYTVSVCTADHAIEANHKLQDIIQALRQGEKKTIVIGTGHGTCTCQGAAFEYIYNVDHLLREEGVRHNARIIWLSNEFELGDFGMGSVHLKRGGYITNGKLFAESLMVERGMEWIVRAHVTRVEPTKIHYETLDGEFHEIDYDFSMLIPPFSGVGIKAFNASDEDITSTVFAPSGFMRVDADYTARPYAQWSAKDWPQTYQNPTYANLFAIGIAFAPPHQISKPMQSKNGTMIAPAPPRTGMPSAAMAIAVANNVAGLIKGQTKLTHTASMAEMGAACVASTGSGLFNGSAATMAVYPVVPDYEKYPNYGRDLNLTFGEIGLAGHWMKTALHYMFMYQAQMKTGWRWIPD